MEVKANRDTVPSIQMSVGGFFFSPFLKDSMHKSLEIKLMVPPTAITLLLAEKEQDINITSYPAVRATYVQGGKLWLLREP